MYLENQIIIFLEISIHLVLTDTSNVEVCVDMLEKILIVIMVKYGMMFWLSKVTWALNRYILRNLRSRSF